MILLAVEDLTLRFGGLTAIDNVSFEVARGEVFTLIGPNGAGKPEMIGARGPEDLAILVYTSGTTGPPKGAMLSHRNIVTQMRHCMQVLSWCEGDERLAFLPACHVAVFDRTILVESLAQMGLVLEAWHEGPEAAWRGAAINFITGPSRTADIELTLTRGVHGPKEVHAVFVEQGLTAQRA